MESLELMAVGQPFPVELLDMPGLSWDPSGALVMVVPADDSALIGALADGDLSLGVCAAGPMPVLILRVREANSQTLGYWEAPGPWREGQSAPEVSIGDGDRILWQLVAVEGAPGKGGTGDARRLPVLSLRAFTTSPAFTRTLRRLQAEQRAAGPMSTGQALAHMRDYYAQTEPGSAAWRSCAMTSRAGE